jgi:hypothetical protein
VLCVQQSELPDCSQASKADHKVAAQLLMKALAEKNVPFNFVTSRYFQAYVALISGHHYSAPSRFDLIRALEDICDLLAVKIKKMLDGASFVSICADAWTSTGRHITAVTGGAPGESVYLNSYENHSSDTAETTAAAIHDCVLVNLGLKTDMETTDSCYPQGRNLHLRHHRADASDFA